MFPKIPHFLLEDIMQWKYHYNSSHLTSKLPIIPYVSPSYRCTAVARLIVNQNPFDHSSRIQTNIVNKTNKINSRLSFPSNPLFVEQTHVSHPIPFHGIRAYIKPSFPRVPLSKTFQRHQIHTIIHFIP